MRLIYVLLLTLAIPLVTWAQIQFGGNQDEIPVSSVEPSALEKVIERADSLRTAGEIQSSVTLLDEAIPVADSQGDEQLIQSFLIQQVMNYLSSSQYSKAENMLLNTLDRYPQSDQKAQLLRLLGNTYRYQGRFEEAFEKQEEARALVDSAENPQLFGSLDHDMGALHSSTGNYGTALKYYLRSINIAEITGDSTLLAKALNSVGVAYNNSSQHEKAKHHLEQAIGINKKLNNQVGLLRATNNLAISYDNLGNFEQSIATYNEALQLHREIRPSTPPFRILYNLGQLHKKNGELDKAEKHFRQSLSHCKEAGIMQGLVYNYGGLANVAELRENFSAARSNYQKALEVARNIGIARLERDALRSLYLLEKSQKNYRQALSHHETFKAIGDSLQDAAIKDQLEKTETELGLRRQEEVNKLLQDKQQQQEARIVTQNWLIATSSGIILVIAISLYLLYRSNREKRQINAELEHQRNKLQELNKVKDKMLAIISHDLRSPMASMSGMLYLIREQDLSREEIRDMASSLEVSLNQNITMMDNLLVWAREQMSGLALDTEVVNAHEIVREVVENSFPQAESKGIKLINEVGEEVKIEADPNLFRLILRNLISNGIKFSSSGDQIVIESLKTPNGKVEFKVRDTGIGIPEEKQEKLFTVHTESRAGTNNEKGSGLGLKLCKEFVEKQNGEISLQSVEGEGTTFTFSLPKAS